MEKVTGDMIINDVVNQAPATMPVFNRHNLDTCCGGGVSIAEGAKGSGADIAILLAELNAALKGK